MKHPSRRAPLLLIVLAGALALAACPGRTVTVLSYNVENLFDGVDHGTEYKEYDPGRGAWTDSLYRRKLARIALVIRRSAPGGPDIVLLQEIENRAVLEALRKDGLGDLGYAHLAAYGKAASAATVGILSRFPLHRVAVFMVSEWKGQPLREILEAAATVDGTVIHLFCNHWKSKNDGKDRETEKARVEAAGIIARRTREIARDDPNAAVIAAGDLNENPGEYRSAGRKYQTALLLQDDAAPADYFKNSLVLSARPEEAGVLAVHAGGGGDRVIFFEPWLTYQGEPKGSYVYRPERRWEAIDHILFLPGGSGFRVKSFRVVSAPDMLHPRSRYPLSWEKKKPDKGYSDHLPILLTLEK